METNNTSNEPNNEKPEGSIFKYILIGISFYFIFVVVGNMKSDFNQNDDAWIGSAIILLGIVLFDLNLLFGKNKKKDDSSK